MTLKQKTLLTDMFGALDTEFDFGKIGRKSSYTNKEASELIGLNKDMFFGIIDGGQCTVPQYKELTRIAGRKPKLERHLIGFSEAVMWINQYGQRKAV